MKSSKSIKSEIITSIIIGLLTIGGSFVVAMFTPDSFLVHPVFEINPDKTISSEDTITIKNTGWVQAKNVEIDIITFFSKSKIVSFYCPEGNMPIESNWMQTHEIKMDRLSVNVDCSIILIQNSTQSFYDIVVTADNSPAYKWFGETKTTRSLSNPLNSISIAIGILGIMAGVIASIIQIEIKKRREKEKRIKEFDILKSTQCPNCGSDGLIRYFAYDDKRDDEYCDVLCKDCKWSDGSEL